MTLNELYCEAKSMLDFYDANTPVRVFDKNTGQKFEITDVETNIDQLPPKEIIIEVERSN